MTRHVDYDHIASTYDRRYQENKFPGLEQVLLDFVGEASDLSVLEVGCGTGYWLQLLSDRRRRLAGLDVSRQMLARARTQASQAALVQGRAERLPWGNALFDRVFCINAFHHFRDKPAFLAEARRVLRSSGKVLIVGLDPHAEEDRWFIYDYFTSTCEIDKGRYPPTSCIREWMQAAGFSDCITREAEHLVAQLPAREAMEQKHLEKTVTSQLSVLTEKEYQHGIERIHNALTLAETRGERLFLSMDLRLYATFGVVDS